MKDIIRHCRFSPYLKGEPRFDLKIWDTHRMDSYGKSVLGYCLRIIMPGTICILFEGEDFCAPPLHGIDSDATVVDLMSFLTLRPGDTDTEYFQDYTPEQLEFCSQHAEALRMCVLERFGGN